MIKVSFILPCYNVEPYIARCLDSLLMQDMPQDEYEIICVNDCSPDHLREVVLDYQKRYPIVRLIEHTVNKTAGGARNTGLDAARGKYVWFVDPDDMISQGVLSLIFEKAESEDLDILYFNFDSDKHQKKMTLQTLPPEAVMDGESFLNSFFRNNLTGVCTIWRALYKKDYLDSNAIRFPQIKSSQDVVFAWKSILMASRVSSIQTTGYIYYRRQNSTTGSKGRIKPEAAMSASLLYPNELLNIIDEIAIKNDWIIHELHREIKATVNDDSRNVLSMNRESLDSFYGLLSHQKETVDRLSKYMNTNTKRIFNYRSPFILWANSIKWLSFKKRFRKLF